MNIILTGIPRSGTTLSCSLLNKLPQCVALHEPMNPTELINIDYPKDYIKKINNFFKLQRLSLNDSSTAVSKVINGVVPDNSYSSVFNSVGLRDPLCKKGDLIVNKFLNSDFKLIIKHPNFFSATLEILQKYYQCFAIVRNPLAILLSWDTTQINPNRGYAPFAEAFDMQLKADLASESDRVNRQLILLKWYFCQYSKYLASQHIIYYEDIIESNGRVLGVIDPAANFLNESLNSRNLNMLYNSNNVRMLADKLIKKPFIYEGFYEISDIEILRDKWTS